MKAFIKQVGVFFAKVTQQTLGEAAKDKTAINPVLLHNRQGIFYGSVPNPASVVRAKSPELVDIDLSQERQASVELFDVDDDSVNVQKTIPVKTNYITQPPKAAVYRRM
jgi:hypothetical protein